MYYRSNAGLISGPNARVVGNPETMAFAMTLAIRLLGTGATSRPARRCSNEHLPSGIQPYLGPEVNDEVGEGVQFRGIGTLGGIALFMVRMTSGWYTLPKLFDYITKSEKSHGSARAYSPLHWAR